MAADGRERRENVFAWTVVALVQAVVGAWLLRLPPPVEEPVEGEALSIQFIHRPGEARRIQRAPRVRESASSSEPAERVGSRTPAAAPVESDPASSETQTSQQLAPLDLRVPPPPPPEMRRDPFDRAPTLDARSTRFSARWVPEGDALRQASFHSAIVRGALGAFGGPPRHCTEVERRLRQWNCLPLHGQEADDEALRRSLDP